ncbi:MAG TPA: aminotransferase class I and II [Burkholderiaceae bacterium]|nr:aminotransferase class I and II [Burkholderiaceae bacterium]
MRTVAVTRYVTPLREGGSLPAVVEADDDGMYVLKFRGAGQGARALIAELVAGELARVLGLPVPEIVFAELDADLARTEPDPEIQDLIRASEGLNLALDYLPGAINYDPIADRLSGGFASRVVWFDAFVSNLDRTARNTNLMIWHGSPWLIDHGAALYFHHSWNGSTDNAAQPFSLIRDHVLLPQAGAIREVDAEMAARLSPSVIEEVLALVPDNWLEADSGHSDPQRQRRAYADYLSKRLELRDSFIEEAIRARG